MSLRPKREMQVLPPQLSANVVHANATPEPTSARLTVDYLTPVEADNKVQRAADEINIRIENLLRKTGQRLGPLEAKTKQTDEAIELLNAKLAAAEANVRALNAAVEEQKTEIATLTKGLNAQTATIQSLLQLLPAAAGVVNAKAP